MNLKHSRQRDSIKEFLASRKDHPTADVVYAGVRQSFPNISLGTVYRNLTLLADMGEDILIPGIMEHIERAGVDHFDYNISPHYHFICSECGCVTDLELPFTQDLTEAAREEFAGEIVGQITYFCGRCGDCIRG